MPDSLTRLMAPELWPTFVFITARLSGLMLVAPLWSMSALPRAARAAIIVALSVMLLPIAPRVPVPEQVLDLPVPIAMELVVGIVIGLTAAVIVQGVALAGEVVSMQMGLSLGHALAPMPEAQLSDVGQIKSFLALLIYVSVGGHLVLFRGLADSLRVLPPGLPMDLAAGGRSAAMMVGTLYSCAVRAAAPVMVTLLLANVALAILGRAVPQVNAMLVSFPFTIGVGLVMLGAALPIIAWAIGGWMQGLSATVAGAVASFRAAP
jgi:flagellar biosynthetic protein FliR